MSSPCLQGDGDSFLRVVVWCGVRSRRIFPQASPALVQLELIEAFQLTVTVAEAHDCPASQRQLFLSHALVAYPRVPADGVMQTVLRAAHATRTGCLWAEKGCELAAHLSSSDPLLYLFWGRNRGEQS